MSDPKQDAETMTWGVSFKSTADLEKMRDRVATSLASRDAELAALRGELREVKGEAEQLRDTFAQRMQDARDDMRHLRLMGGSQMYNTIKLLSVELDAVSNAKGDATREAAALRGRLDGAEALLRAWVDWSSGPVGHGARPAADTRAFLAGATPTPGAPTNRCAGVYAGQGDVGEQCGLSRGHAGEHAADVEAVAPTGEPTGEREQLLDASCAKCKTEEPCH